MLHEEYKQIWFYIEKQMNNLEIKLGLDKKKDNEVFKTKRRLMKKQLKFPK